MKEMNDTGKLYQEYRKIQKIIRSSYDIGEYPEDARKWIESRYKRNFNGYKKVYLPISYIRSICQSWLDRVVAENEINRLPKGWMDMIRFGLVGKYKERKRFMELFYTIYYEMSAFLDTLDGGPDAERPTTSGFSI